MKIVLKGTSPSVLQTLNLYLFVSYVNRKWSQVVLWRRLNCDFIFGPHVQSIKKKEIRYLKCRHDEFHRSPHPLIICYGFIEQTGRTSGVLYRSATTWLCVVVVNESHGLAKWMQQPRTQRRWHSQPGWTFLGGKVSQDGTLGFSTNAGICGISAPAKNVSLS